MNDRPSTSVSSPLIRRIARLRVPLGFVAGGFVYWLAKPTAVSIVAGGLIALVGAGLRVWAAGHLDKAREVTKSGPYRWMRHPLYVGSAVLGAGLVVAARSTTVMLIVAGYLLLTIGAAIRHEEATLQAAFGDEYGAYKSGTSTDQHRRFAIARVRANRESRALIGALVVLSLLAAKAALS